MMFLWHGSIIALDLLYDKYDTLAVIQKRQPGITVIMKITIKQDSGGWCVVGDGVIQKRNFFVRCNTREDALLVAHRAKRDWFPRAELDDSEVTADILREERYERREHDAEMNGDWSDE